MMQSKGVVIGLPAFESKRVDQVCEACQLGKKHRLPFLKESSISKGLLDVINSDVWGPVQAPTIGGCRYYVTFIDNHLRYTWIFPMKKKSEVLSHFQKIKSQIEKKPAETFDAYDRMEERSTSPTNSSPTSKVKAYGENSRADTHPNKME